MAPVGSSGRRSTCLRHFSMAVLSATGLLALLQSGRLLLGSGGDGGGSSVRGGSAPIDAPVDAAWAADYAERGFGAPFRVVPRTRAHAVSVLAQEADWMHVRARADVLGPIARARGTALHAHCRELAELAASPAILARVRAALRAEDVMLYETQLAVRTPGVNQQFHADAYAANLCGADVGVWLALRGVNINATLEVLPYSQTLPEAQEVLRAAQGADWAVGAAAHAAAAAAAEAYAAAHLPAGRRARLQRLDLGDGDAAAFDLRLWHGSVIEEGAPERVAVVFRYKQADCRHRYIDWASPRPGAREGDADPPQVQAELPRVMLLSGAATPERLARNAFVSWQGVAEGDAQAQPVPGAAAAAG